jgi:hypothetical protein
VPFDLGALLYLAPALVELIDRKWVAGSEGEGDSRSLEKNKRLRKARALTLLPVHTGAYEILFQTNQKTVHRLPTETRSRSLPQSC